MLVRISSYDGHYEDERTVPGGRRVAMHRDLYDGGPVDGDVHTPPTDQEAAHPMHWARASGSTPISEK